MPVFTDEGHCRLPPPLINSPWRRKEFPHGCDFVKLTDSRIGAVPGGSGIYLQRIGNITIDGILGAGHNDDSEPPSPLCDTFIYFTAAHGTVIVTGCECEGFITSLRITSLQVGNYAWPIVLLNNTFGNAIKIESQCEFVSIGNRYLIDTVHCDPNAAATIYSFGDAIIGLNKVPVPSADFHLNDGLSRLASRANHYRLDFQRPARFGGRAGTIPPLRRDISVAISMPDDRGVDTVDETGEVPPTPPTPTQLSLCDAVGTPLFNLRADADYLYFEDGDSGDKLMRLDRHGNLALHGAILEREI